MPRIEYRALTLRMETYERVVRAVHRAKKKPQDVHKYVP